MLLKHLYDLAHSPKHKILAEDAFDNRSIRFVITLDQSGKFTGVQDISPDGKRGFEFPTVPKTARIKKGKVAEFLVDGIDSIFGLSPDPSKPKDAEMLRAKCEDFWSQVEDAAAKTKHSGLVTLAKFKPPCGEIPSFLRQDGSKWMVTTASGTDVRLGGGAFTFKVGEELIFANENVVKPHWRGVFAQAIAAEEADSEIGLCLITGDNEVPIARTHAPRVANIPNVGIDGTVVSFEKSAPAFSSYGKVQSNNAPCSVTATRAYSKALQFLVDHPDHQVRVGNTKFCFWAKEFVEAANLFARLLKAPKQDEVAKFLKSPWSGIERDLARKDQFFAVTLAGNSGRIVVRQWLQEPLDQAIDHFHAWFTDLKLKVPQRPASKAGKKADTSGKMTEFHPLSVYWLACSTVREAKDLAPDVPTQLYRAALEGTAPSVSLIKPILDQLHSKIVRDENYQLLYDQSRFALLKLILNRQPNRIMEIGPELTACTDDAAYNCGRLLAILSATQSKAHEYKLEGAGVAERYFGTASVSPGSVFPLLLRLNRHHLNKIKKSERFGGHERFIEEQMQDVLALFKPAKLGLPPVFPRNLDLQAQGRFALGFYQQQAAEAAARQAARDKQSVPEAQSN